MPTAILLSALGLTVAALVAAVLLLVMNRRDNWRALRAFEARYKDLESAFQELRRDAAALREEYAELHEKTGMLVAPAPLPSGLNMTKRAQATRMLRKGEPPEQVAAALNLPRSEVALLATVDRLVSEGRPERG